jgi:hypothetical protein
MEKIPSNLPAGAAPAPGVSHQAAAGGRAREVSNPSPDDADNLRDAKLSQGSPEPALPQNATPSSHPSLDPAPGVPVEAVSHNPIPTPDATAISDALHEAAADNSNHNPDSAEGEHGVPEPTPFEAAAANSSPDEEAPHLDPGDASGSIHGGHYDTQLLDSIPLDELPARPGFEATSSGAPRPEAESEAAPEPGSENFIKEIERGEETKGRIYFLFGLLRGQILLPAEYLSSYLSNLMRELLKKGYIIDAKDRKEIWKRLQ